MSKSLLLIDDDMDDTDLFCEAINEIAPTVACHVARDSDAAFEKLKTISTPDLIFLDINMPRIDGWQCLARLKSEDTYKDIPVIMYSTSSNKRDMDKAREMGATSFFSKPHDYRDLKKILAEMVK